MATIEPKIIPKTQPRIMKYFKLCSAAIGSKQHILSEVKAKNLFDKQVPLLFNVIMGKLIARETVIGGVSSENDIKNDNKNDNKNDIKTTTHQKNYQPILLV